MGTQGFCAPDYSLGEQMQGLNLAHKTDRESKLAP
jgi:hypothetical protein